MPNQEFADLFSGVLIVMSLVKETAKLEVEKRNTKDHENAVQNEEEVDQLIEEFSEMFSDSLMQMSLVKQTTKLEVELRGSDGHEAALAAEWHIDRIIQGDKELNMSALITLSKICNELREYSLNKNEASLATANSKINELNTLDLIAH